MSGGTIFKGSRPLRGKERRYLFRRWALCRSSQAIAVLALAGFHWWAAASEDDGLRFLAVILAVPALWAVLGLQRIARPFALDLRDNRVESVIGAVAAMDLSGDLVPLHLGEDVYQVQSELLRRKRSGEPIMVEYLRNTGLAVTIDGHSNLMSWKRWMEIRRARN